MFFEKIASVNLMLKLASVNNSVSRSHYKKNALRIDSTAQEQVSLVLSGLSSQVSSTKHAPKGSIGNNINLVGFGGAMLNDSVAGNLSIIEHKEGEDDIPEGKMDMINI